jgi:glutamine amidotransferase-like uncharacterized protein
MTRFATRQILSLCIVVAGAVWSIQHCTAIADDAKTAQAIRVAIYAGAGASQKDPSQVKSCLPPSMGFEVETITADDIRDGALDKFDVVIHPGGSASKQGKTLGKDGRERVRRFVKDGGGFIGICAGAYLASAEYPWALKLLDARVIDDEHWARGQGEVQLRFPPSGRAALGIDREVATIYFENGPLLGPAESDDIPDYESLAAFETELAENGAPTGVMKSTTAIARGEFCKGRVVCFSPHPEKTPGREAFVSEAVRWAAEPRSGNNAAAEKPQSGASQ